MDELTLEELLVQTNNHLSEMATVLREKPDLLSIELWLSPLMIMLSTGIALLVGYMTLQTQRRIARTRASLDMLLKIESDSEFIKASGVFQEIRDSRGIESIALAKINNEQLTKRAEEEELYVDHYLNTLELLCVGMCEGIIDELYIYQYMRGGIIKAWEVSESYTLEIRKIYKNERVFQKLELFAKEWEKHQFVTRTGRKKSAKKYFENNLHDGGAQS